MSSAYNPETLDYEQLASLTVEAQRLRAKRDTAGYGHEREALDRVLRGVEADVECVRRRLRVSSRRTFHYEENLI